MYYFVCLKTLLFSARVVAVGKVFLGNWINILSRIRVVFLFILHMCEWHCVNHK